nr:fumarylacetoacetate hydrolase family protein [Halobaculum salinum]
MRAKHDLKYACAKMLDGVVEGQYMDGMVITRDTRYEVGEGATLLASCEPSTLYCLGKNYTKTLDQMDYERPSVSDFFIKPLVPVHPPRRSVPVPHFSNKGTYADELAAVIDREASRLDLADIPEIIREYTIMNDLNVLDQESRTARKAFDESAPLGPRIETDLDPTVLARYVDISGERRQEAKPS